MQLYKMNYTYKDNDTLVEMSSGSLHQTLTPVAHGGHDMLNYGSMGDIIMDNSYFSTDSMDLQSNFDSMTLFPTNSVEINQQHGLTQEHQQSSRQCQEQSPSMDQFGPPVAALDKMHTTPAPVVKSQACLIKTEDLWSPPTSYNAPPIPLPTGAIQSWTEVKDNTTHPLPEHFVASQQYQPPDAPQWCAPTSLSPSYQDMMLSDIYSSPVPTSMVSHYNDWAPQEEVKPAITKKAIMARRSLPRRHTVSTVYNAPPDHMHNNTIYGNQQQQDLAQQAKMRKMLKARRHRSLGRLEVPSHYLTKLDTASPSSLSCGTSRCGSPLSAECLSSEQHLDHMFSMNQLANHHQQLSDGGIPPYPSYLVQPIYQISPPIVQSQQHMQMMDDDMYSMATTSHTSTNTAPTSPVLVPGVEDESDPDDYGQDTNGPHTCQWGDCRMEFQILDHLIEHTKTLHIGSGKPLYYCRWKECARGEKPFTKRHKMHNHLRTHTGERPYICTEEGCGKRFSRPDSMATHTKIHTNIRPYACQHENCDKAYYHLRSLRKHEKSHEIPPPLPTSGLMDCHLSVLELKD